MALLKITNGFERMPDASLLDKANFIWQQMSGNPHFTNPVPSMTELAQAKDAFAQAVMLAANGDRQHIAAKKQKRDALVSLLHLVSYYVLYAAAGDSVVATSAGFTLAKFPSPQPDIQKPTDLKVENTSQSGELRVSVKKVKGAKAYIHQYTTDPLQNDNSWVNMTCTASKCKLDGLTPGTVYYVRVGAVGAKEQIMYSDVIGKMAA